MQPWRLAADGQLAIQPGDPEWTQLVLRAATTDDLRAGNQKAGYFPGGYARVAKSLKPGLPVFAWEYVKPGADAGMPYDGLYFVHGRWVWVPKPYRLPYFLP